MNIDKHIKNLLIESLSNDYHKWTISYHAGADWQWVEYHSPEYDRHRFHVGNLNYGTCVSIDGLIKRTIFVWPFSKLWKLQRRMKGHVKENQNQHHEGMIKEALNVPVERIKAPLA